MFVFIIAISLHSRQLPRNMNQPAATGSHHSLGIRDRLAFAVGLRSASS
jgi:hypothetical protein